MRIDAALTYDKIRHDQARAAHLVISLTAPLACDPDGKLGTVSKELGRVATTYATDVVLELKALAGHEIVSVVSDVQAEEEGVGGEVTIRLPEILAEEPCDLVFAVKLRAQKRAFPRPMNVFGCKLGYDVVSSRGRTERKVAEVNAKVQFVQPGAESLTPNEALGKIVVLAEIIRARMAGQGKPTKGDLRRKMLLDLRAALERGDDQQALTFAGQLVGLGDGGTPG